MQSASSSYQPPVVPTPGLFIRDSTTPPPSNTHHDDEEWELDHHKQVERHATLLRNISSVLGPGGGEAKDEFEALGRPPQPALVPGTATAPTSILASHFSAAAFDDAFGSNTRAAADANRDLKDREMNDMRVPLLMRSGDYGQTLPFTHNAPDDQQAAVVYVDHRPAFECNEKCRTVTLSVAFFLALMLAAILVPLSYHGIDRHMMGFFWYRAGTVDTSHVYTSGLYFVGLNRQPIMYPTTYQLGCFDSDDMTFPTATGQVISVDVCFHYVLTKDGLASILRAYGTNFSNRVMSVARSALKTVGSQFTVDEFVTQRDNVAATMVQSLQRSLTAAGVSVTVATDGMLLGFVTLPESLMSRNLAVFEQTQLQVQQQYEFQASQIRYDTRINITSINASTAVLLQAAALQANQQRAVAALVGTATLRSTVGRQIFDMANRLALQNLTAIEALTKYTLYLSAADRNGGLSRASNNMTVITPADTMPVLPSVLG